MYSDTLLALERAHLLQLVVWGGASVLAGAAILAILALRRARSALLANFAVQCLAWGTIEMAIAANGLRGLAHRDGVAAVTLERLLWLNTGLDVGYFAVGLTLAITGWLLGRRLALVGAGIGVVLHGLGLFILHLRFIAALSPIV